MSRISTQRHLPSLSIPRLRRPVRQPSMQTFVPSGIVPKDSLNGEDKPCVRFLRSARRAALPWLLRMAGSLDEGKVMRTMNFQREGWGELQSWTILPCQHSRGKKGKENSKEKGKEKGGRKGRDKLFAHAKRPSGSMAIQYVGCSLRIASAVSCETVVMAAYATIGVGRSSPSCGDDENKNCRVTLWAPSAPMSSVPSSMAPSANVATTPVGVVFTDCKPLPN